MPAVPTVYNRQFDEELPKGRLRLKDIGEDPADVNTASPVPMIAVTSECEPLAEADGLWNKVALDKFEDRTSVIGNGVARLGLLEPICMERVPVERSENLPGTEPDILKPAEIALLGIGSQLEKKSSWCTLALVVEVECCMTTVNM